MVFTLPVRRRLWSLRMGGEWGSGWRFFFCQVRFPNKDWVMDSPLAFFSLSSNVLLWCPGMWSQTWLSVQHNFQGLSWAPMFFAWTWLLASYFYNPGSCAEIHINDSMYCHCSCWEHPRRCGHISVLQKARNWPVHPVVILCFYTKKNKAYFWAGGNQKMNRLLRYLPQAFSSWQAHTCSSWPFSH